MSREERERRITAGEPYALRLDMAAAIAKAGTLNVGRRQARDRRGKPAASPPRPRRGATSILARKETPTSYHLSVTLDDALQGVTHVVRGQDLFWSTSVHRLLQVLLGLPAPQYHHHRLILGSDGRKLAKSTGSTALRELRAQGATRADIRRMVGPLGVDDPF